MQSLFRLVFAAGLAMLSSTAFAGDKIKVYFNHTVDNSVSTGTNAINLNGKIDDTLAAYINRAKYTLDIAVYNFTSTSTGLATVFNAVNNAYTRGVKVRWIYNGTSATANTGLSSVNSAIPKLASPSDTGSSPYGIMHNKFMVIDANSPDPNDAVVWTGSTNWSVAQFDYDYDNVVILQDSALAHVYRAEFNMMWGDTGMTPNNSLSKFGPFKTDLGRHNFTIDGKQVELYFSPSDNTNSHIASTINTADKDLYFGLYIVTDGTDANNIITRKNNGVYVAGIIDAYGQTASGTEYPALLSALTSTNLKGYNGGSNIYHNKYLIVDPSDVCSDPLVLTGSHNWTSSANTKNDENTLIIHDASVANQFYQSFRADFTYLGGTLSSITGCTTSVTGPVTTGNISVYPNPADGDIHVNVAMLAGGKIDIDLITVTGKIINLYSGDAQPGTFTGVYSKPDAGLYTLRVRTAEGPAYYKLVAY